MRRIFVTFLCIAAVLLVITSPVLAQQPTGTPPFGTYSDQHILTIDMGNLDVHMAIPIFHKRGRGLDFNYAWEYDNESIWSLVSNHWTPAINFSAIPNIGYQSGPVLVGLPVGMASAGKTCSNGKATTEFYNFAYTDVSNTVHAFPSTLKVDTQGCIDGTTATAASTDGLYSVTLTATVTSPLLSATVRDSHGTGLYGVLAGNNQTLTDRNGNQITDQISGTALKYTDTLGLLAFTSDTPTTSQSTYTYTGEGGNELITEPYQQLYLGSAFVSGCTSSIEYTGSGTDYGFFPTKFSLPDGSNYIFGWEQTPGKTSSYTTGRLSSVHLPSGGTISVNYNGSNHGMNCDGSTSGMAVTTPDGTWNYVHTQPSGTYHLSTTTVTDPAGNKTVYTFTQASATATPYEVERQVYTGSSTLLETVVTCYNGQTPTTNCPTAPNPITSISQITRYVTSNGVEFETNNLYNSSGLLTEQDDYDVGGGAPGPLIRKRTLNYGNYNTDGTCTALGNNIQDLLCYDIIWDSSGHRQAETIYNYDQTTVVPSGATQLVSVTGSRGNLTTLGHWTGGQVLNTVTTFFDTGLPQTVTDVNNDQYTYTYGDCDDAFPTNISEPAALSESMTWDCNGAVRTSLTDVNSKIAHTYFSGESFWRPSSSTDVAGNATSFSYSPTTFQSSMNFGTSSTSTVLITADTLGRTHLIQKQQAQGSSNYDSVETDYNSDGLVSRVTIPYSGTAGQTNSTIAATTYGYDGLGRVTTVTDNAGLSTTLSYNGNTLSKTLSPTPTGETAKRWLYGWNGLGWITQICEITGNSGTGTCNFGPAPSPYGFWTQYGYNVLGKIVAVSQNVQSSTQIQTRSFAYDALGRLTSEGNPESGTTSYTYDTSSAGDLATKTDANNTTVSYSYTNMHRLITASSGSTCRHFAYDQASAHANAVNVNGRLAYAYTDACSGNPITKEYFSYGDDIRGTDLWETTPHSGTEYHVTTQFYPNGTINTLVGVPNLPNMTYGIDGEGRPTTVTAGSGQNPVTSASYNVEGELTGLTLGSGDSATYGYNDTSSLRMKSYTFAVNGVNDVGTLTWNANGTLQTLAISDGLNSTDSQTCNYLYDAAMRLTKADCGTVWGQNFSYDAFGNIGKTVIPGDSGLIFTPNYGYATNRYTSLGSYDNDGHLLNDTFHTYTWSPFDEVLSVDGTSVTHDAFGRLVEKGGTLEFLYLPSGQKIADLNGTTLNTAWVPLPGGSIADYHSGGLDDYAFADWLGSARLSSTPSRAKNWDVAFAPFGEVYAGSGGSSINFTGNFTTPHGLGTNLWDFQLREQHSSQGRWIQPDPAGLAAVHPMNPQTWNRYAYVGGMPLTMIDLLGLDPCEQGDYTACVVATGTDAPTVPVDPYLSNPFPSYPGSMGHASSWVRERIHRLQHNYRRVRSRLVTEYLQAKLAGLNFTDEFKEGGCVNQFFQEAFGDEPTSQISQQDQAIKASAQAGAYLGASAYAAERGLIVPMRSSIVRGILKAGETAGESITLGLTIYDEGAALANEVKSYQSGECQ